MRTDERMLECDTECKNENFSFGVNLPDFWMLGASMGLS
jgi:hypothetical protein